MVQSGHLRKHADSEDSTLKRSLTAKYGDRLAALDKNNDGVVDRQEMLQFVSEVVAQETRIRYWRYALFGTLALLVLFALTTFGSVWAVVALTQKVDAGGSAAGPALVSSDGGETLRTAIGMLNLPPLGYDESVRLLYYNHTMPSRRRVLLSGTEVDYVGHVDVDVVLQGCALLLEGNRDITAAIKEEDSDLGEEITGISVQKCDLRACRTAIKENDVSGLRATIIVDGYKLAIYCPTKSECHVLKILNDPKDGSRRRLLGASEGDGDAPAAPRRRLADHFVEAPEPESDFCFPASARVRLEDGTARRMDQLRIGDRVLVAGNSRYEDVYMFGHRNPAVVTRFVRLTTASGTIVRLSPDHYLPVVRPVAGGAPYATTILSSDALPGDWVTVVGIEGEEMVSEPIVAKALVADTGLYNPYTASGTIVVDGVVASCHSSWVLDGAFKAMGVEVPRGYQAAFAPVRLAYRLLGPGTFGRWVAPMIDAVAGLGNGELRRDAGDSWRPFWTLPETASPLVGGGRAGA